jgi:hypothetical protein
MAENDQKQQPKATPKVVKLKFPNVDAKKKVVKFSVADEEDNTNAYIGKQHLKDLDVSNGVQITIRALGPNE